MTSTPPTTPTEEQSAAPAEGNPAGAGVPESLRHLIPPNATIRMKKQEAAEAPKGPTPGSGATLKANSALAALQRATAAIPMTFPLTHTSQQLKLVEVVEATVQWPPLLQVITTPGALRGELQKMMNEAIRSQGKGTDFSLDGFMDEHSEAEALAIYQELVDATCAVGFIDPPVTHDAAVADAGFAWHVAKVHFLDKQAFFMACQGAQEVEAEAVKPFPDVPAEHAQGAPAGESVRAEAI